MSTEDTEPDEPALLPEQRVGAAMREARESHGVSLRRLANQLGYQSHTTLSGYERGAVMPTETVVEGYERLLGLTSGSLMTVLEEACTQRHGDAWTKRRVHLPTQFVSPAIEPDSDEVPVASPRLFRRWGLIAGVVGLVVVAGAVTAATFASSDSPSRGATPIASPTLIVVPGAVDGADPKVTGCATGATTADSVDVFDPPEHLIGVLELRYSAACGTSWGRFTPTSALTTTPPLMLQIDLHRPADNGAALYQVAYDGQAAFGNMLLSRSECVYAELTIHRGAVTLPTVQTACKRGGG